MAVKNWQTTKVQYCQRVDEDVNLEALLVFPADILPDQPPRVIAHRCSKDIPCNMFEKPACIWAGTNPEYDPFLAGSTDQ